TPKKGKAVPEYIEYVLRLYKYSLERDASQGAQKNINYGFLKPLKVPIPLKLEKQKEIVRKIQGAEKNIEKTLNHLDEVIQTQLIVKNHLHSLQNSIFDKAFTGKLVN
ncbi:MAG: restriction endonuclease subunit S, partial [Thaumarchaeota archaeon]|nr:restriction endonuclease subunit S [Nitrososphaerota archaeon]